jgi:hypothetical protein
MIIVRKSRTAKGGVTESFGRAVYASKQHSQLSSSVSTIVAPVSQPIRLFLQSPEQIYLALPRYPSDRRPEVDRRSRHLDDRRSAPLLLMLLSVPENKLAPILPLRPLIRPLPRHDPDHRESPRNREMRRGRNSIGRRLVVHSRSPDKRSSMRMGCEWQDVDTTPFCR